jgi:hypothetical protein
MPDGPTLASLSAVSYLHGKVELENMLQGGTFSISMQKYANFCTLLRSLPDTLLNISTHWIMSNYIVSFTHMHPLSLVAALVVPGIALQINHIFINNLGVKLLGSSSFVLLFDHS